MFLLQKKEESKTTYLVHIRKVGKKEAQRAQHQVQLPRDNSKEDCRARAGPCAPWTALLHSLRRNGERERERLREKERGRETERQRETERKKAEKGPATFSQSAVPERVA